MSNFDSIHEVVKSQTANARVTYLDLVRLSAGRSYDNLPNKITDAKSKISSLNNKIRNCCKEKRDPLGRLSFADLDIYIAQTNPMRKEVEKLERLIRQSEKFISMGKESFVETSVEKAAMMFDSKVFAMADKLNQKGFTPECKFSSLSSDPKLFDVVITDGEKKVHARSVLAAEFSECMVAHFRFIITNAK